MGIFKGGRRKELQQEIDSIDNQISNMKKRLSSIVREYKFDSVQAFYKEFNAAKKEYLDYQEACAEWEKIYGEKAAAPMSIRDRLRLKEQIVKEMKWYTALGGDVKEFLSAVQEYDMPLGQLPE